MHQDESKGNQKVNKKPYMLLSMGREIVHIEQRQEYE